MRPLLLVLSGLLLVVAALRGLATAGPSEAQGGGRVHVNMACEGPAPITGTAHVVLDGQTVDLACDENNRVDSELLNPGSSWVVVITVDGVTCSDSGTGLPVFIRCVTGNRAVNFSIAGREGAVAG